MLFTNYSLSWSGGWQHYSHEPDQLSMRTDQEVRPEVMVKAESRCHRHKITVIVTYITNNNNITTHFPVLLGPNNTIVISSSFLLFSCFLRS